MANPKKVKGILLISREKLDCFISTVPNTLFFSFPPTVYKNMDVVDKNGMLSHIQAFIQTNKLPPSTFTLIINENILFEKFFPHGVLPEKQKSLPPTPPASWVQTATSAQQVGVVSQQPKHTPPPPTTPPVTQGPQSKKSEQQKRENEEEQIEQFIDSVPFEETLAKTIKSPEGTLVIVANRDPLVVIKDAFEKTGHSIESVIPATVLGKEINLTNGLTVEVARALLPKLDAAKSQTMLIDEEKQNPSPVGSVAMGLPQKASEKRRLFIMIGVFGVLIIIMIVLILRMNAENAAIRQRASAPLPTVVPTVEPTALPSAAASTSAAYKQALPIQITINPTTASFAAQLQQQLRQTGYQNIIVDQRGVVNAQPLVVFTGEVPDDVKREVTNAVTALNVAAAVQQNTTEELRVIITL